MKQMDKMKAPDSPAVLSAFGDVDEEEDVSDYVYLCFFLHKHCTSPLQIFTKILNT